MGAWPSGQRHFNFESEHAMTTTANPNSLNAIDPANVLSAEELAPLMERKRQVQAELAANQHPSQAKAQGGCSSGGCGSGGQSSFSASSASSAADQPNVVKAVLIAVSILAVAALAWWGVTG